MSQRPAPPTAESPTAESPPAEPQRPTLRVVRGDPTAEELAALSAVVTAAAAARPAPAPPTNMGRWADPFDRHPRPWQPGVGGWRSAIR